MRKVSYTHPIVQEIIEILLHPSYPVCVTFIVNHESKRLIHVFCADFIWKFISVFTFFYKRAHKTFEWVFLVISECNLIVSYKNSDFPLDRSSRFDLQFEWSISLFSILLYYKSGDNIYQSFNSLLQCFKLFCDLFVYSPFLLKNIWWTPDALLISIRKTYWQERFYNMFTRITVDCCGNGNALVHQNHNWLLW